MAKELTVVCKVSAHKGAFHYESTTLAQSVDLTGNRKTASTQDLTTAWTALEIGADMETAGWGVFSNLSDVATVEVGSLAISNTYPAAFASMEPAESYPCPLATLNLWARVTSGTGSIDFTILER